MKKIVPGTVVKQVVFCLALLLVLATLSLAQSETATLSGTVMDQSGSVMPDVEVQVTNADTNTSFKTTTNKDGIYVASYLRPGRYRIMISKRGFKQITVTDLTLHVQDLVSRNFTMQIGAVGESITVSADAAKVNTESATVGTLIDRNFVNNLPLNGRSFNTLILLTPGMVATPVASNGGEQGQFSANGQRTNANYFTVDGVSANFGVPNFQGLSQGASGSWAATNIQGGFSNLVSVDALQEFKIQTSTYAPEFGRSPGAQISMVTRSGGNDFHGSVYEYFRNDVFDAKDWFDKKKPPLRYNDFGGTFSGPIWKNKTFFFFSYEGQRFMLPQPNIDSAVPSLAVRQAAPNATSRALLDAFPLPNGPDVKDSAGNLTGAAIFNVAYSNPNHSDSYAIRIDHTFNSHFSVFGRYNNSPSNSFSRATNNFSTGSYYTQNTRTLTFGSTQVVTNSLVNEVRLNFSQQDSGTDYKYDGFGGGKLPDESIFFPSGTPNTGPRYYLYYIYAVTDSTGYPIGLSAGTVAANKGRSINFVDNFAYNRGKHAFKFGFDYRRNNPMTPGNSVIFGNYFTGPISQVYSLTPSFQLITNGIETEIVSPNYSIYGQDTWRVNPRLTLTYGLRWEINPPPTMGDGKKLLTLSAPPDLSNVDMSGLQLAPTGTPFYETWKNKFAPRLGVAYQLLQAPGKELVLRAGWGMFYDLASTPFTGGSWPYISQTFASGGSLPASASQFTFPPPDFTPSPTHRASGIAVASNDFTMPRTYQWNLTLEQGLGRDQTISVGYVGSQGRKLLRTLGLQLNRTNVPAGAYWSPNFSSITYVDNASYSDYHSMQVQFKRQLSKGFQAIVNYTWAHSTDDSSSVNQSTAPGYIYAPGVNHGASNFDVRHNFTAAFRYEIPSPKWNKVAEHVLGNWAFNSTFFARTGLPTNILINETNPYGFYQSIRRPDLVSGVPIWISDPTAPGGKRINNAVDATGQPLLFKAPATTTAQGNLGRNSIYGFGAWQSDIGINRTFNITERIKSEFRVEMFNIFNHPNFINPYLGVSYTASTNKFTLNNTYPSIFGMSNYTMARGYGGGGNTGGFNPLFQVGGPRSMQFALRLSF